MTVAAFIAAGVGIYAVGLVLLILFLKGCKRADDEWPE